MIRIVLHCLSTFILAGSRRETCGTGDPKLLIASSMWGFWLFKWATDQFIPWASRPSSMFVINNFVRDWGHRFIFDEPTLREAFDLAGFENTISIVLPGTA